MRKFLFFILMLCSIVGLVSFIIFPVYKYDSDQITKNNTEYVLALSGVDLKEYYNTYDSLPSKDKKIVKEEVKQLKTRVYAIRNKDYDTLYECIDYIVINDIYKEKYGKDAFELDEKGNLIKPSDDSKKSIEQALTDALGEEQFNVKKKEYLDKTINEFNELVNQDKYKQTIIDDGKLRVNDELFNIFFNMDNDLMDITTKEINEKGLFLVQITRGITVGFKIDKAVWQKPIYKDVNFFQHVSRVFADPDFYNPFPLLLLIFLYLYLVISLLSLIFKSIKGLRGRKRPKLFFFSIINFAICCLLLFAKDFIPLAYVNKFHYLEYQRLLDWVMYGKAELAIYIVTGVFGFTFLLSIIQIFLHFGRRRKEARQED